MRRRNQPPTVADPVAAGDAELYRHLAHCECCKRMLLDYCSTLDRGLVTNDLRDLLVHIRRRAARR